MRKNSIYRPNGGLLVVPFLLMALLLTGFPLRAVRAQTAAKPAAKPGVKKRAVLVGISDYCRKPGSDECSSGNPKGKSWWNLNSDTDVVMLAEILKTNYGFDEITILRTKAETTRAAIVGAFRTKLIEPTQENDIVYFHYSGHGASIPDDGDPGDFEPDGMDESLVPSDYVTRQDGSNNIRDDEIGKLLDELNARKPGNVTITLDSCHSGTATRGGDDVALQRGQEWQGEMPKTAVARGGGDDASGSGFLRGTNPPKNYLFLAAANPRQTAWEYTDTQKDKAGRPKQVKMGLFTYALTKALRHANSNTSYRDLFYQISATIAGTKQFQNPQIEGMIDTAVLNGAALPVDPFLMVTPAGDGKPLLRAGELQGITKGSKYMICPADTRSREDCAPKKLADAAVSEVYHRESLLAFEGGKKPVLTADKPLRAFETERALDFSALRVVATEDLGGLAGGKEALAAIRQFALGETTGRGTSSYDVMVRPADAEDRKAYADIGNFSGAILLRSNGTVFAKVPAGPELGKQIRQHLENEVRWKTVVNMNNTGSEIGVDMRLFPTLGTRKEGRQFEESKEGREMVEAARKAVNTGASQRFDLNEYVRLEIRNPNKFPIYVTVLDLMPNGVIGPAFPDPGKCVAMFQESAECNNKIEPGATIIQYFRLVEPVGTESFKALVTRDYTDFSPLLTPDASRTASAGRGNSHPLGTILQALYNPDDKAARRGIENISSAPQTWATQTVTFEVVKRP